jgi:alkylation response protein AidB-like acyl-CoA dehydrogenase
MDTFAHKRLKLLQGHVTLESDLLAKGTGVKKERKIQDDVWAIVGGDDYLTEKEIQVRKNTRAFMEKVQPQLINYINNCEFPHEFIPEILKTGCNGFHIKDFGGPNLSQLGVGAVTYEMNKIDASLATFVGVHNSIGMEVIDILGSDEQRARYLPDGLQFKKIFAFGLTEPEFGSDATSLRTTAKKVEGGYILNGKKRWIGNSTFPNSVVVVWARNEDEGGKI